MPRPKKQRSEDEKTWVIRDVDMETRTAVRVWAVAHGLTVGQALRELVDRALRSRGGIKMLINEAATPEDVDRELSEMERRAEDRLHRAAASGKEDNDGRER